MTVGELIKRLQAMPADTPVEINDNGNGDVWDIVQIDLVPANRYDVETVVIQVNC